MKTRLCAIFLLAMVLSASAAVPSRKAAEPELGAAVSRETAELRGSAAVFRKAAGSERVKALPERALPFRPVLKAPAVVRVDVPRARELSPVFGRFSRVDIGEQPECVHAELSCLHFPGERKAQDGFYSRIDSLLLGLRDNVNIWHIGGSHVQGGYFPYRLMTRLDSMADSFRGDRGVLFPYRLIGTNYDQTYRVDATGEWVGTLAPKKNKYELRYGLSGIAVQTSTPDASLLFDLSVSRDTSWTFNRVRVLGYGSSPEVRPFVQNGADTLSCTFDPLTESWLCDLPAETDTVRVGFEIPKGETFTLTGVEPISGRRGINYWCSGANGAMLSTWLNRCTDLQRDLQVVRPDLAIFAVGINDSACKASEFKYETFKSRYRRLISLVRAVSPDCCFIFITNNDSYRYSGRRMVYNANGAAVRQAMFELAEEYGAAVWDLYDIMGGEQSVTSWRDAGLARPDRLHFTKEGYSLLGDLMYNAIVQDYNSKH